MCVSCYHRRGVEAEEGDQHRDVLYILVYSQQLHLGEQEEPDGLYTQTNDFLFATHPLWISTKMCDGSLWLPTSPSNHHCIFVTNQMWGKSAHGYRVQSDTGLWFWIMVPRGPQHKLAPRVRGTGRLRRRDVQVVTSRPTTQIRRWCWDQALPSFKADGVFLNVSRLIFGMQPLAGPG